MRAFHGIAVSPGIADGTVLVIDQGGLNIPKYWLHDREVEEELKRYREALTNAKTQIQALRTKLQNVERREHLLILEGHLAMLDDVILTQDSAKMIRDEKINAEWALSKTQKKLFEAFSKIDEEYFRERQNDVTQVIERVQRNLLGKTHDTLARVKKPVVIVSHNLSPVDMAHLPRNRLKGFVTDVGGRTSHTGIVAASMEIPAVVGIENFSQHTRNGDRIIVDGLHGVVIVNPSSEVIEEYRQRFQIYSQGLRTLQSERELPSETQDHFPIRLVANMELLDEIPFILSQGAQGVGLFRSEFLFLESDRRAPTEEEQFKAYRNILERFAPHSVTMRTYDLGGEKDFAQHEEGHAEPNPALGLRAIRYCLREKDLFKAQLRAMLRASAHGKLQIMFPMISDLNEFLQARKIVEELREELLLAKKPVAEEVLLGVMIETPAAVMIADLLAEEVDFFSVGTNDLIQYTLAVDRVNEAVAYLYNPLHPAILHMLERVTEIAHRYKIPAYLCGEMASDPLFLPVLVGLGFHELSMNAVILPQVKHLLRSLTRPQCQAIYKKVRRCSDGQKALEVLREEMAQRFPEYFE